MTLKTKEAAWEQKPLSAVLETHRCQTWMNPILAIALSW